MTNPRTMYKHLRRLEQVWVEPTIYFVTVCTSRRQALLATDAMAGHLVRALREASEQTRWCVGRYVIMPDHVHFFCAPTPEATKLSKFVGVWKCWTTRLAWGEGHHGRLWQPEFFDHLLRNGESYGSKWEYLFQNPVRAGICQSAEEWPYQGELVALGT